MVTNQGPMAAEDRKMRAVRALAADGQVFTEDDVIRTIVKYAIEEVGNAPRRVYETILSPFRQSTESKVREISLESLYYKILVSFCEHKSPPEQEVSHSVALYVPKARPGLIPIVG
ncbi:hypothetical protein C8Q80DRAFT_1119655 [Daedaleopsis nitida]|nr:hypothetical protein C8Q80DRAFT_1119655 [Daedaleopsis nitida]